MRPVQWLSEEQLMERVGLNHDQVRWFNRQFVEQMRFLVRPPDNAGSLRYHPDAVAFLSGVSAMVSQGATPEQIRSWFGLA